MLPIALRIFPIHMERTSISKSFEAKISETHTQDDKGTTVIGVTLPASH